MPEGQDMNWQSSKKIRYYAKLHYPVFVTLTSNGFCGSYPDLPGCVAMAREPDELYRVLDETRREWIAERVVCGEDVPVPNTYLQLPSSKSPIAGDASEDGAWPAVMAFEASV